MKYLMEMIVRYCKAANIPLLAINNKVDLYDIFLTSCEKSLMGEQQFTKIKQLLEEK